MSEVDHINEMETLGTTTHDNQAHGSKPENTNNEDRGDESDFLNHLLLFIFAPFNFLLWRADFLGIFVEMVLISPLTG